MKIIGYIVLFFVVLIGVTFALLNSTPVSINYYVGVKHVPLSLLLAIAFVAGGVIGLAISLPVIIKQKAKLMRLHAQVHKLQGT